jgi:DNA-directed RNA polymerase delta subunit
LKSPFNSKTNGESMQCSDMSMCKQAKFFVSLVYIEMVFDNILDEEFNLSGNSNQLVASYF